eukprot:SAG31_NODE_35_length_31836_cov_10.841352_8_plen_181_part_00
MLENGRRAFFEYWPLSGPPSEPHRVYRRRRWGPHVELLILDCRSYRGMHTVRCPRSAVQAGGVSNPVASNDAVPQLEEAHAEDAGAPMLGRAQHDWLLRSLLESTATWKFICSSVPLSFPTGWPRPEETGYDGAPTYFVCAAACVQCGHRRNARRCRLQGGATEGALQLARLGKEQKPSS